MTRATRKTSSEGMSKKTKKPTAKKTDRTKITSRTMEELRIRGYQVAKVEYWSPFPPPHGRRHDLFNCIDVLGVHPIDQVTLGVQCTSRNCALARVKKILTDPEVKDKAKAWLLAGNGLEVWGWDRYGMKTRILKIPILLSADWQTVAGERMDYQ